MALVNLIVKDFVYELASASPTPGGGSASALAGAMAAAMVEMVCNLTVGREKFRDVEADLQTVLARATQLREQMLAAMDADANSYDGVSRAYKLPKGTDAEKAQRTAAIQAALKQATEIPLAVAKGADEIYQLGQVAIEKGNPNVSSDGKVALLLSEAARDGAVANVEINLGSISDGDFVERMQEELKGLRG